MEALRRSVEEATGNNAIIVCPGVAGTIAPAALEIVTSSATPADLRWLFVAMKSGPKTLAG